tara:strand:- start:66 stop:743 length:678 start_codon:yes stop_codon:yes gene_type:complete
MNICLIPARSGSKRIKNKNILKINNKPIIHWCIRIAKNSKIFDKIFVSSDSKKIINIAKKAGAISPFVRPKNVSDDKSTDYDVLDHFLRYAKKNRILINSICFMYPTCILISPNHLKLSYKKFLLKKKNLIAISSYSAPVQIAMKKINKNLVKFVNAYSINKRTQDMKKYFHDSGQFYWYRINKYKIIKSLSYNYFYLERKLSVDLDTKEDLELLKILFKSKRVL